jgi:3-oxoacyl-(acyl-carrier-protein) synthase
MQVAVVGLGLWSPYGRGLDLFWQGLTSGRSAMREIDRFDVGHKAYRTRVAAAIDGLVGESDGSTHANALLKLDKIVTDVIADASLGSAIEGISPYDCAIALGCSTGPSKHFKYFIENNELSPGPASPTQVFEDVCSTAVAARVAKITQAQGPSFVTATACASATSSIGFAYQLLRNGRAKRALAGGIGWFSEIAFSGFNILRVMSKDACRPFDLHRDGMLLGDAIALVLLEDLELALKRNAPICALVSGYADGNDAFHATRPDPSGDAAFSVMWNALGKSRENLDILDYINAHGTATKANDVSELHAVERLISKSNRSSPVSVSSTKGHHGHALGAAGAIEFIATVLALRQSSVPPTLGLSEPDGTFTGIDFVMGEPRRKKLRAAMSNSFAFGGNVASIFIKAHDAA